MTENTSTPRGEYITPDRWRLVWDLVSRPQDIAVLNAAGVRQYIISGKIDRATLDAHLAQLKREHSGQLPLFVEAS